MHIMSARMYCDCEFFRTELEALAIFGNHVSLPLLNLVEVSPQSLLLEMLPKLYTDLLKGELETLTYYRIKTKTSIPEIDTPLKKQILGLMCKDAAKVLMMQCGREYGFDDEDKDLRATLISSIEESKLDKLPKNNLICARAFSVFDRRARVAASGRNRNFQGHGLRDDMVLYDQSTESLISRVDKVTGKVEKY